MRALPLFWLLASCATDSCKEGTVFLSYTLTNGAEAADTIEVTLAVGSGAAETKDVPRKNHGASGSIEVQFGSYPTGQSLAFTVTAKAGATPLASLAKIAPAAAGCTALSFVLDGSQVDMSMGDLASADLQLSGDLANSADLASSDLTTPPDMITGPGCIGQPAICGPDAGDSCCLSPLVTGGTFKRGYDVGADNMFPDQSYPATVSDFRLDKYEITVGRFRAFVLAGKGTQANPPAAGAGAHANIPQSGWDSSWNSNLPLDTAALVSRVKCDPGYQTYTDLPGPNDNLPITCVNWYEVMAFCAWDGGYLPTEAEWNYAASGGSEQRTYPWASPAGSLLIDNSYAVYNTATVVRVGSVSPKGDGKFGQSDLAGDNYEWMLDVFPSPYPSPCSDCANLTGGTDRSTRGGSFANTTVDPLRTSFHYPIPAITRYGNYGARCARPK